MLNQGFTMKVSLQPERKPNDLNLGCSHNLYDALLHFFKIIVFLIGPNVGYVTYFMKRSWQ